MGEIVDQFDPVLMVPYRVVIVGSELTFLREN